MGFRAIFNDNSEFSLYDSSYFNDKAIFNLKHQSNLISFSVKIAEYGIPKSIIDDSENTIEFKNSESFETWFKRYQSVSFDFGFADKVDKKEITAECKKRNDLIIELLTNEIKELKKEQKFNTWRLNGGYKNIEKLVLVTNKSIEQLENKKVEYLKTTKLIFKIVEKSNIISHSKKHNEIEPDKLLTQIEKTLKKIEKTNNKKWWSI